MSAQNNNSVGDAVHIKCMYIWRMGKDLFPFFFFFCNVIAFERILVKGSNKLTVLCISFEIQSITLAKQQKVQTLKRIFEGEDMASCGGSASHQSSDAVIKATTWFKKKVKTRGKEEE